MENILDQIGSSEFDISEQVNIDTESVVNDILNWDE